MGTIHGRYGIKELLVDDLIIYGINLNELKPGTFRDRRTPESRLLADTESWMLEWRVSLEDMKEGTFYDVLENDGRDVDGRKVTKEEARRIIDKYNNYNRNRYFDVDEKKMRKVRKPLNLETLDELRKSYGLPPDWEKNIPNKEDKDKEKEKTEKEKAKKEKEKAKKDLVDQLLQELGLPPPPEVDEAERPPLRTGWLLDEGSRKMFKDMKPDPNEDPYEDEEEEQKKKEEEQKKKKKKEEEEEKNKKKKNKKKIVSHPIPDVPIKYEGSWESILTKHLNLNLNLENATMI